MKRRLALIILLSALWGNAEEEIVYNRNYIKYTFPPQVKHMDSRNILSSGIIEDTLYWDEGLTTTGKPFYSKIRISVSIDPQFDKLYDAFPSSDLDMRCNSPDRIKEGKYKALHWDYVNAKTNMPVKNVWTIKLFPDKTEVLVISYTYEGLNKVPPTVFIIESIVLSIMNNHLDTSVYHGMFATLEDYREGMRIADEEQKALEAEKKASEQKALETQKKSDSSQYYGITVTPPSSSTQSNVSGKANGSSIESKRETAEQRKSDADAFLQQEKAKRRSGFSATEKEFNNKMSTYEERARAAAEARSK